MPFLFLDIILYGFTEGQGGIALRVPPGLDETDDLATKTNRGIVYLLLAIDTTRTMGTGRLGEPV